MWIAINETLSTANNISAAPISFLVHLSLNIAASAGAAKLIPSMDGKVPIPNASITTAPETGELAAEAVSSTL